MKIRAQILCLLLLMCLGGAVYGAEIDGRLAALIEGAKKETKMIFYTSVETEFARSLTQAFEAKYPFIKTDVFRSSHDKIFSRLNVERQTGTYTADAISVGEFETFHLQRRGFIAPYKSPHAAAYPEGFKDPNGYWTDLYDNLIVTAYNTIRVKRDEIPKRYEDLLHPRWKRRMVFDQNEDRWFANMLYLMGEKKGMDLMQGLAKQEIAIRSGRGLVTQLLGAGEYDLQIVAYWYRPHLMKKQGAPVDWIGIRARDRCAPSDQCRREITASQRREAVYRLCAFRGGAKTLRSTRPGIGSTGAETGRVSGQSKTGAEPCSIGGKAR